MICEKVRDDLDALALGALSPDEAALLRAHLTECEDCTAEYRAVRAVSERLLLGVPQVRAPAALRDAVLAVARQEKPLEPLSPTPSAAAQPPVGAPGVAAAPMQRGPMRLLFRAVRVPLPAAAAVAALIVGLAAWAAIAQVRTGDLRRSRDGARAAAAIAQSKASLSGANVQQLTTLLSTPHTVTAGLQPVGAEPSTGVVVWNPDQRRCIVLARRLAPLDAGQEYHVWFEANQVWWDGGVLHPDATGTAENVVFMDRWAVGDGYAVHVYAEPPQPPQVQQPSPVYGKPRSVLWATLSAATQ